MKPILAHFVFLYVFYCVQHVHTEENSTHITAICYRCQCLGARPFTVDCDDMNFKKVPEFKRDLKLPWRFTIRGNSLTSIPVFPYLENLTALSFRYNDISTIEEAAFLNLTSLQSLDLSHNNLTANSLNHEMFRGPFQDKLPNPIPLESLNLSHNGLNRLKKHVFKHLTNLTSLDLSNNPFIDFTVKTAASLSELQNLKKLDLSYTKLKRLPDHFFAELFNLVELDLSGNNFVVVPPEVNYAHSLRTLSFNDNIFGVITEDSFWDSLEYLETLYLKKSRTLFRVDNGAFGNLTSLQTLWLSDNIQLSDIFPLAFTNKHNRTIYLKELHLENNDLEYLPENAIAWKNIPYLNLQGNPWNCDCNFEWLAKDILPAMHTSNYDLTIHVTCAHPLELMGQRVTDKTVQEHEFVCVEYNIHVEKYGFIVVAIIVVGTLLLVTGTVIFSYVLFRRTKIHEWVGENVKYRRALNEDEEIMASNIHY